MTMDRIDLINAINGIGFPSMRDALKASALGLTRFIGDQHNPEWAWDDEALMALSDENLASLYASLKAGKTPDL